MRLEDKERGWCDLRFDRFLHVEITLIVVTVTFSATIVNTFPAGLLHALRGVCPFI